MHIAVAGSVATDHLMTFQGKFADSLVPDQLDKLALSFLVDDLDIRRGGCGANIAFGLAALGHKPLLVAAVGEDFEDLGYRDWLVESGVECDHLYVSPTLHTARCTITTDDAHAQIVTFYAGAMGDARNIDLAGLNDSVGGFDLVLIGPDDPEAMLRHTQVCRDKGLPFAADPSQQLAWAGGEMIRRLIDGATYLFSNDYEAALIEQKTGWTTAEVQARVGTRVVTHGPNGVMVYPAEGSVIDVRAIEGVIAIDPTGVGDSFRAGFLAAVAAGLSLEHAAHVGCTVAASVVETKGTQEYALTRDGFLERLAGAYGDDAAAEVGASLNVR
ncbi:MAG: carbohydrate kinase family protein [Aeromicrobium sp.]